MWGTGNDNSWRMPRQFTSLPFLPINKHHFLPVFPFLPVLQPQKRGRWPNKEKWNKIPRPSCQQPAEGAGATGSGKAKTLSLLWALTATRQANWDCPCCQPVVASLSLSNGEMGGICRARSCGHPPRRKRKCRRPASRKWWFLKRRWLLLLHSPRCPHRLRAYSIIWGRLRSMTSGTLWWHITVSPSESPRPS